MSLDLTQNINLYLAIITSVISIILLIRISRMSKIQKKFGNTIKRLKYEINKMQDVDNKILKNLSDEPPLIKSWAEEDEHKQKQKEIKRKLKLQKRIEFLTKLRNKLPDNLERFAGEQILDKFGIAAFLAGLALFINMSMELDWINDFGRLFFGIFLTIVFLVAGYLIRNKFVHFSNILIGGGIASFIFAIFSAFYQYDIINLVVWIILTLFVLAATILISISVKRHEIAIITFLAAYVAPFTVKFISSDYFVLFSYLTILNLGIIFYDYFQKSVVINLFSFGFTFMIYGIWLISKIYFKNEDIPYLGAFIFLTLFYIMFLVIIIVNNIREGKEFHKLDFSIMMAAKGIYLSVGLIIINQAGVDYQGLFAGLIGVINYSFFLALFKRKKFDRRILNQFLGLSIMFFALIIPIEFYGKTITMVWSLQAIVLMFVAVKSKMESMRFSSFIITVAMIVSLIWDMYSQYLSTTGTLEYIKPFLNKSFLSAMLAMASLVTIIFLLPSDNHKFFLKKILKVKHYKIFLAAVLLFTGYFTFFLEIKTAAIQKFDSLDAIKTAVSIYNMTFFALAALPVFLKKYKKIAIVTIALALVGSLIYVFAYAPIYVNLRNEFLLSTKVTKTQYILHFWAALMILFAIFSALKHLKIAFPQSSKLSYIFTILLVFALVYVISTEITNIFAVSLYQPHLLIQDIVKNLHRFAYSVTWAVASLLLMTMGFVFKVTEARIISMFLYGITLSKIILFDFWTASNQDLMISFAVMGVVMLISSFLFQLSKKSQNKLV